MSEPYWVALSATDQPLNFAGAYSGAASYRPGDVVLYNGVYYLCYANATGVTPPAATPPSAPIVTSLPASPYDGQEVILVDSLTAPTYSWRLQYSAGITDVYKWVFVGGAPLLAEVPAVEATASTTYVALATAGPVITLPRAGVYQVEIGFRITTRSVSLDFAYMSYDIGPTAAVDADAAQTTSTGASPANTSRTRSKTFAAAAALTAKYRTTSGSQTWADRWMRVTPARLA